MEIEEERLKNVATYGATEALRLAGLASGEISQNQAMKVYKTWFTEAVKKGRIRPCRMGSGISGTKWYLVSDILQLKEKDLKQAELQDFASNK